MWIIYSNLSRDFFLKTWMVQLYCYSSKIVAQTNSFLKANFERKKHLLFLDSLIPLSMQNYQNIKVPN